MEPSNSNNQNNKNDQEVDINNPDSNSSNKDLKSSIAELTKLMQNNNMKKGEMIKDEYKFWESQPVPQFNKDIGVKFGPIDKDCSVENERKEPFKLPTGFTWYEVDINNNNDLNRLYEFLRDNYVEDDDHMFRFDYSKEFLHWHLTAPGYLKRWHVAVMKKTTEGDKMIGFISAIPVETYAFDTLVKKVEINFLCVNSAYRAHRLATVLIKEITRRVHLENIWQAVYTAGVLLPKPFAKCTYYHRNLNVQKLLDVKFTYLGPNMNLARAKGIYKVPGEPSLFGIRPMESKDVEGVYKLLNDYLKKFKIRPHYTKEEVAHWFIPRDQVVYAFVVENDHDQITDFISFYSLPSTILNHDVHKKLFAAYSFFNVATTVSYKELIKNALILAKKNKFDVYNALNIMENGEVFEDLLFGQGDGTLKYYFYNFACPEVEPSELALVLM